MSALTIGSATSNGGVEREGIIDSVLRFYDGLDANDYETFISSSTSDCVMDVSGVIMGGQSLGILSGLHEEIVPKVFRVIGPIGSTHSLSNFRVAVVNPAEAFVTFHISAQHFKKLPEGSDPVITENYLMSNKYKATVVKAESGVWLVKRIVAASLWAQGNLKVMSNLESN